jgi:subtilase family serine protease
MTSVAQTGSANKGVGSSVPVLITGPVDENNLVTLAGNTRPEANTKNDRGRVADDLPLEHMMLQLRRPPQQEKALENYIDQLQDPASPYFHKWLTAKQIGQKYGLAQADINAISGWLRSHGFAVNYVYQNRLVIDFSGTAGQVRLAFHTEIHNLQVGAAKHTANMTDPKIPAALAPAVVGVVSLNDFMPHPMYKARVNYSFSGCGVTCYSLAPQDLATIYNFTPVFNSGITGTGISGQGQTIVVVEDSDMFSTSDWDSYRSVFGLGGYSGTLTQVHPSSAANNCADPGVNSDDIEATLDVEVASAAAPSAAIQLASCTNTASFGGFIALQNLLDATTPPTIVSISYGDSETNDGEAANASISSMYQQAVTEGVSVFVSAGDQAAAASDRGNNEATNGINVSGWASTVYNVAVGGTDFSDTYSNTNGNYWSSSNTGVYGSAFSYIPEIPWNDSCASVLLATFVSGSGVTYGTTGFCNSATANTDGLLNVTGGGGGPSACATGVPTTSSVVSGTCAGYAKPSWQSVFGNPNDGVRDLPDVSLFAANGVWGHFYTICFSDTANGGASCSGAPSGWTGIGGTSASSPIMAGVQALINQSIGSAQGNPNPMFYQLAATEYGASGSSACDSSTVNPSTNDCIFYDVTQGDMDVPCMGTNNCYLPSGTIGVLSTSNTAYEPAYGTATGWDFATGIGTVNVYNLVKALTPKISTTSALAITATPRASQSNAGQPVTLTATVTYTGTAAAPTGTVTFLNGSTTLGTGTLNSSSVATVTISTAGTASGSTLGPGTYSVVASYSGDSNYAASTSPATTLNVVDFTMTVNPATVTVSSPGQTGQTTLTITAEGGFNQTVNYSCSGLPSETSCMFAASGNNETLTFMTTESSSLSAPGALGRERRLFYALLLPSFFGLVAMGSVRRGTRWGLLALILTLSILWLPACSSSGSSGSTSTNSGTPTGSSTVMVTAFTSGANNLSQTVQVTLTVQ